MLKRSSRLSQWSTRGLCLLLLLALLCPCLAQGQEAPALRGYTAQDGYVYVTLGSYPQSIDGGDPKQNSNTWKWASNTIKDTSGLSLSSEPILWRVLTVDESKAYLCSEYVLFAMPLHVNYTEYKTIGKDFGQTDLCHYLNETFAAEAFTAEELQLLLEHESYGKVFLLSSADVKNKAIGMGNGEGLKAWATEYAIRITGAFVYSVARGAHSPYWVCDQSTSDKRHGRCTKAGGTLGHIVSDRENEGVRPAVYLALDAFAISGGSGSKADPYVIVPKESGAEAEGVQP